MRSDETLLFQKLVASSLQSIAIATPWFVADRRVHRELIRALQERRVSVRILTGRISDPLARRSSRRLHAALLGAGARIFECQPALLNANVIVVDRLWSLVGPTRPDRWLGLKDGIDLAVEDGAFARRLLADFDRDLSVSREISDREWRRRPLLGSLHGLAAALLRQYWPRLGRSQSSSSAASPASRGFVEVERLVRPPS